jgi:hypothetical protein
VFGIKSQAEKMRNARLSKEPIVAKVYSEYEEKQRRKAEAPGFHRCPLCGTVLAKTEKVKSVVYPGKPDSMMEIFGCPYCYSGKIGKTGKIGNTAPNSRSVRTTKRLKPRICPVCTREMPANGLVYARFFQSSERRHAHVLGCTQCYTRHR